MVRGLWCLASRLVARIVQPPPCSAGRAGILSEPIDRTVPGLRVEPFPTVSQPIPSRRPGGRLAGLGRLILAILLLAWFSAGAGYLVLRHYLWPRVDTWRPELVERLSRELGRPVDVGRIETGFDGLLPRITLTEVAVRDADGPAGASPAWAG